MDSKHSNVHPTLFLSISLILSKNLYSEEVLRFSTMVFFRYSICIEKFKVMILTLNKSWVKTKLFKFNGDTEFY